MNPFSWFAYWVVRQTDRIRWQSDMTASVVYADLAHETAIQARAALRGGYLADARRLIQISNLLKQHVGSPDLCRSRRVAAQDATADLDGARPGLDQANDHGDQVVKNAPNHE